MCARPLILGWKGRECVVAVDCRGRAAMLLYRGPLRVSFSQVTERRTGARPGNIIKDRTWQVARPSGLSAASGWAPGPGWYSSGLACGLMLLPCSPPLPLTWQAACAAKPRKTAPLMASLRSSSTSLATFAGTDGGCASAALRQP